MGNTTEDNLTDVLVIGAGSIGIATAYYLKLRRPGLAVSLMESAEPLALTSAQSGENYRNWWPHRIMKQFMDRSIELMEQIARDTDNAINLSRRGYVLATRDASPDALLGNLETTYTEPGSLREHSDGDAYSRSLESDRQVDVTGVDILNSASLLRQLYPYLARDLKTIIHIRHAGTLSAQQLGSYMLQEFKARGGKVVKAEVREIAATNGFDVSVVSAGKTRTVKTGAMVNAAGPFAPEVAAMAGVELPVTNVLQQKIAFEDTHHAIDRSMPFMIDLDNQLINWSEDERRALAEDPVYARFLSTMPGSIHCRPEGASWIKLGWAYNGMPARGVRQPELDEHFPEIVIRGASRMLPALKIYQDGFPKNFSHYGGYYTLTDENWPLVGGTEIPGCYVATAMSGFGTMAACAAGELVSQWVLGDELPEYAKALSLERYSDEALMQEIANLQSRGIL
ncbi:MAG: FAD-binding oxidoreductase [Granulosicoccus sp.]|nr:FAD-binding oxidoreductase [Granulosicoccus sp.]